jgi:hypothetical protein
LADSANPGRSARFDIEDLETMDFYHFYFRYTAFATMFGGDAPPPNEE